MGKQDADFNLDHVETASALEGLLELLDRPVDRSWIRETLIAFC